MFIDELIVKVIAGNGGDGCTSFRREKYVPKGGPDGGNGGRGGNVVFVGDRSLKTLIDFKYKKIIKARKGEHGKGSNRYGANSDDIELKVPLGTTLIDMDTNLVIGDITEEKLTILQDADYILREEIKKHNLDTDINQYFAVLTNIRSVGVMGDMRTYDYMLAIRAVKTLDFMTANFYHIPYDVLEIISKRIVNEVGHINRVVYDITSKPPATIEWE